MSDSAVKACESHDIMWCDEHMGSQQNSVVYRTWRQSGGMWCYNKCEGQSNGTLWCDEHGSQMAYCGILNVRAVTKSTDLSSCQNILWLFPTDVLAIDIFDYPLFWNFSLILPDLLNKLWNAPKLLMWTGFLSSPCSQQIDIQISESISNMCVGFSTKSHSLYNILNPLSLYCLQGEYKTVVKSVCDCLLKLNLSYFKLKWQIILIRWAVFHTH